MDVINTETKKILFSQHVPGTGLATYPWVRLRDVDFSGVGIEDISTAEGKTALRRLARECYVIEEMVARWKTDEEMYDLEKERADKLRRLQIRVLEVVRDRGTAQVGAAWRDVLESISGDQVAVFGALLGLCYVRGKTITIDDIVSQYVNLKNQIEAATSKKELDAIVIP